MTMSTTDYDRIAQLVQQSLDGEAFAFEQLVRMHIRSATTVALAVTGCIEDAEDVAQNAFILAYSKLHTCREPHRFSGWLLQIVKNQSMNWVSNRSRREKQQNHSANDTEAVPAASTEDAAIEKEQLLDALSCLDGVQRQVFLLHVLEGWAHAEISDFLQISMESSRWHLFNARKILKVELSGAEVSRKKVHNE